MGSRAVVGQRFVRSQKVFQRNSFNSICNKMVHKPKKGSKKGKRKQGILRTDNLTAQSAMWVTALGEFPPPWAGERKRLLIALSKVGLITHLTAEAEGKEEGEGLSLERPRFGS